MLIKYQLILIDYHFLKIVLINLHLLINYHTSGTEVSQLPDPLIHSMYLVVASSCAVKFMFSILKERKANLCLVVNQILYGWISSRMHES